MSCFFEKKMVEEVREIIIRRQSVWWIACSPFCNTPVLPKSVYQTCSRSWCMLMGDRANWVCLWELYLTDCPTSVRRTIRMSAFPKSTGILTFLHFPHWSGNFALTGGAGCSGPRLFFAFSARRWTVELLALSPNGKFLVLTTHGLQRRPAIASQRTVPALCVG